MSAASIVGRSPCTLSTMPQRPSGSALASASKMRSEPETWSARVITARPPAFSTQAKIASESVATTTGPVSAASARRSTCTIIGVPAMSASGLPGSRVEAIRAGMMVMTSVSAMGSEFGRWINVSQAETRKKPRVLAGYTGCQSPGNRVIHPPPHTRCDIPLPRLEPRRDGLV